MARKDKVGELYVDLKGRTEQLERNLDKLKRKSDRTAKGMGDSFARRFGARMKRVFAGVAVAATVAFAAIVTAGKKVLGMSIKQEETFRKLKTAVELTGRSYKSVKGDMDSFMNSMQKTTRFGDTDMAEALQIIITLTGDVSKGLKGAKLAADIASSGLFDLKTASRYVAMAMEGEITMLGRYVPALKEAALKQAGITGTAQKVAYAMDVLGKKFGGSAQKDLKTFGGAWAQLKNYLGDVLERLGDIVSIRLKPIIDGWIKSLQGWIESGGLETFANNLSIVFTNVVDAVEKVARGINAIVKFSAEAEIKEIEGAIAATKQTLENLTADRSEMNWFQRLGDTINEYFGHEKADDIARYEEQLAKLQKRLALLKQEPIDLDAPSGLDGGGGGGGASAGVTAKSVDFVPEVRGAFEKPKQDLRTMEQIMSELPVEMLKIPEASETVWGESTAHFQEWSEFVTMTLQGVGDVFADTMSDIMLQTEGGTRSLKDAFIELGHAAVREINRIIARLIVMKFVQAVGNVFSAAGGSSGAVDSGANIVSNVARTGGTFKGTPGGVKKLARGGDFIVPGGFPRDTYPLFVESGERVRVTPASRIGAEAKQLEGINQSIQAMNMNMVAMQSRQDVISARVGIENRELYLAVDRAERRQSRIT